jgi:hypothetical protein
MSWRNSTMMGARTPSYEASVSLNVYRTAEATVARVLAEFDWIRVWEMNRNRHQLTISFADRRERKRNNAPEAEADTCSGCTSSACRCKRQRPSCCPRPWPPWSPRRAGPRANRQRTRAETASSGRWLLEGREEKEVEWTWTSRSIPRGR